MALSAATVFEVRSSASDSNGGGFVTGATGVDYSMQDAAQFSLTGIATAGIGATFLSATAASTMVGNLLQVVSGTNFVVGIFQVLSVSVGVSVTVDRNVCTGIGASGVINIGGAFATPGMAASVMVTGNKAYVKSGTYSITSSSNNVASGRITMSDRITIEGYGSTRGDFGTQPVLQASGIASVAICTNSSSGKFFNIKVDGANLTGIKGFSGTSNDGGIFYKCVGINCKNNAFSVGSGNTAILCDATGNSVQPAFSGSGFFACRADSNTAGGFTLGNNFANQAVFCISSNNTGYGFSLGQGGSLMCCTSYNNSGDGFTTPLNPFRFSFVNCLSVSNGGWGYNLGGGDLTLALLITCASYNNTSGSINATSGTYFAPGFATLSGDPFVAAGSGNFALNNTAGAGAACRAGAIPGAFPGGATTGYLDIGSAQHQDSGGSAGMLYVPNMAGT